MVGRDAGDGGVNSTHDPVAELQFIPPVKHEMQRTLLLLLLCTAAFTSCGKSNNSGSDYLDDPDWTPQYGFAVQNHDLDHTKPENRKPFHLAVDQPFRFEFGRGSGWYGLNTIAIDGTGVVTLHRMTTEKPGEARGFYWETGTFNLSPADLAGVVALIDKHNLMKLDREYHAGIYDGVQWVLWIEQAGNEKTVYFNNHFPDAIQAFAIELDKALTITARNLTWKRVPDGQQRDHEEDIWKSIR